MLSASLCVHDHCEKRRPDGDMGGLVRMYVMAFPDAYVLFVKTRDCVTSTPWLMQRSEIVQETPPPATNVSMCKQDALQDKLVSGSLKGGKLFPREPLMSAATLPNTDKGGQHPAHNTSRAARLVFISVGQILSCRSSIRRGSRLGWRPARRCCWWHESWRTCQRIPRRR